MAFSPTDSFVNSQEWTLSRSVPELKVVSEAGEPQAFLGLGGLGLGVVGLGIAPPLPVPPFSPPGLSLQPLLLALFPALSPGPSPSSWLLPFPPHGAL